MCLPADSSAGRGWARMADADLPSFHGIIGRSAAMQALFGRIERVARHDVSVLIQGESGTGKELVASAIQRLSPRRPRPSGGQLRHADTGVAPERAVRSRAGCVHGRDGAQGRPPRSGDGGAVFLDEMASCRSRRRRCSCGSSRTGRSGPVGSTGHDAVDVRVISATHRDLEEASCAAFQGRPLPSLCDVVLEVPPLRARREDIPLLIEFFQEQSNERYGLTSAGSP